MIIYEQNTKELLKKEWIKLSYDITDIINKAIDICHKRKGIYKKIGDASNIDCVKIFPNILIINLDWSISYYEI